MSGVRGVAYFGSRILRHVEADLATLQGLGFTDVVHTFSEDDQRHYLGTMREIVDCSHALGLRVTVVPFGVGGAFGGEASSYAIAEQPGLLQRAEDGSTRAAMCLAQPASRAVLDGWLRDAVAIGADRVMWDEPHWKIAVGKALTCRCEYCLTDPAAPGEWRSERVLVDLLGWLVSRSNQLGIDPVVCLLPDKLGTGAIRDWAQVGRIPGLVELTTDPYWKRAGQPVEPYVAANLERLQTATAGTATAISCWIQGFGLGPTDGHDLETAVRTCLRNGVDDLWVWAADAGAHMSSLGTVDGHLVWPMIVDAFTQSRSVELVDS